MFRCKLTAFLAFLSLLSLYAVEYVTEESFATLWSGAEKPPVFANGAITRTFEGSDWVHLTGLEIKQGLHYHLQIKFRLSKGAHAFIYVENHYKDDKEDNWQGCGRHFDGADGDLYYVTPFKYDKTASPISYSRFNLSGKGKIEILSYTIIQKDIMKETFANGDFSDGEFGWILKDNSSIVDVDGNKMLEQYCADEKTKALAESSPVEITEFKSYRLSYNVKGIHGFGNSALSHNFRVYPVDNRNLPLQGTDKWLDCMSNLQTKYVEFTMPSRHEFVHFIIESVGPCKVQFDNFKLEPIEIKKTLAEIALAPRFLYRDGVFATNPSDVITGNVWFDKEVAKVELTLNDKAGKQIFSRQYSHLDSDLSFAVPAPEKSGDTSLLQMKAYNADGKVVEEQSKTLHNFPANTTEVTFRDDGMTLVNGKPFFQIGHWWLTSRGDFEADLEFLKEAGFNCILMPAASQVRFPDQKGHSDFDGLDCTHKHGLLGVVEIPHSIKGKTEAEREKFRSEFVATLEKYRNHPALFAYLGPDEAMWGGLQLDPIKEVYEIVREKDPYHPLWYNEAPCGEVDALRKYAKATCDTYSIDIYPVGAPHGCLVNDRTMRAVGLHTDRCMEAVDYRKPVWMVLQGFAWAHINAENNFKKAEEIPGIEYPTYEQSRFMAYNAIVHGATGIQYHYLGYTYHVPDQFWKDLRQVTLELEYLSPVYTGRTVVNPKLACAVPGVRFLVKKLEGVEYYLVTNENEKAVSAEFTGCSEKKLNVLFGDAVQVSDGAFKLELPAFGVMVLSKAEFKTADEIFKPSTYKPYSAKIQGDVRK